MEETKKSFGETVKKLAKRYFIDAFGGMAQGLFVTLIAGTIVSQIAKLIGTDKGFGALLMLIGNVASVLMGAGIGVGIAHKLGGKGLVLFGSAVAGLIGAFLPQAIFDVAAGDSAFTLMAVAEKVQISANLASGRPGNPIGSYITVLLAIELTNLIAGKTKLDILIVPLSIMAVSILAGFVAIPAVWLISLISRFIEVATAAQPFIMGVVISVVMGILLTMPTSSAAIWIAVAAGVESDAMLLAGGAAVVGMHFDAGHAAQSLLSAKTGGAVSFRRGSARACCKSLTSCVIRKSSFRLSSSARFWVLCPPACSNCVATRPAAAWERAGWSACSAPFRRPEALWNRGFWLSA